MKIIYVMTKFIVLFLLLIFISCKDDLTIIEESPLQETRLLTNINSQSYTGSEYYVQNNSLLKNFNISDYENVESVFFEVVISTHESIDYCVIDLYNVTDSIGVLGSELKSNSTEPDTIVSGDIYSSIPKKELHLTTRFRSENGNDIVSREESTLIIIHR